jgi:hypothetical protein
MDPEYLTPENLPLARPLETPDQPTGLPAALPQTASGIHAGQFLGGFRSKDVPPLARAPPLRRR